MTRYFCNMVVLYIIFLNAHENHAWYVYCMTDVEDYYNDNYIKGGWLCHWVWCKRLHISHSQRSWTHGMICFTSYFIHYIIQSLLCMHAGRYHSSSQSKHMQCLNVSLTDNLFSFVQTQVHGNNTRNR